MDEFRTEIRFGRVGCILHTVFHEASGIVSCAMLTLLGKLILKYRWLIISITSKNVRILSKDSGR